LISDSRFRASALLLYVSVYTTFQGIPDFVEMFCPELCCCIRMSVLAQEPT